MKTRFLLVLLVWPIGLSAEVFYDDGGLVLERTFADTRSLVPCETDIPFTSFRYPHLDARFNATFLADDYSSVAWNTDYSKKRHGIYRSYSHPAGIECLVSNTELFPGGDKAMHYLFALQTFENRYVCVAHNDRGISIGLIADFADGEGVIPIARGGTPSPEGTNNYFNVGHGAIHDNLVLFSTEFNDPNHEYPKGDRETWRDYRTFAMCIYDHSLKKVVPIIKTGMPLPGEPPRTMKYPRSQNWIYEDDISFRATDSLNKIGLYVLEGIDVEDPASYAPEKIQAIVQSGDEMPGSDGHHFSYISSAPIDSGRLAFLGYDLPETQFSYMINAEHEFKTFRGIYLWANGHLSAIADTDTLIPGKGVTFTGFDKWVSCDKGKVIFRGFGPDGYEAIYLFDPNQWTLFNFADTDDTIDGKEIVEFEIGSNCLVGNRITFLVKFKDRSQGVYLAATPKIVARIKDSTENPLVTHPLAQ